MRKGFFEIDNQEVKPVKRVRKAPIIPEPVFETKDVVFKATFRTQVEEVKGTIVLSDIDNIHLNNPLLCDHVVEALKETQESVKDKLKDFGFDSIQGKDECPVCGGLISYYWSKAKGFEFYECVTNDCLPYPIGGARQRRLNGEPKIQSDNIKFRRD